MGPTLQPAGFRLPGKPIGTGKAATRVPAALHDPSAHNALVLNMQQWQSGRVLLMTSRSCMQLHNAHVCM